MTGPRKEGKITSDKVHVNFICKTLETLDDRKWSPFTGHTFAASEISSNLHLLILSITDRKDLTSISPGEVLLKSIGCSRRSQRGSNSWDNRTSNGPQHQAETTR